MTRTALPQRRSPAPGPRGTPLLGSLFDLQREGQFRFYVDNWRRYGDVVRFSAGPLVALILAHPDDVHYVLVENARNYGRGLGYAKTRDLLGDGLLTGEGETWARDRRLMEPLFGAEAVADYLGDMAAAIKAMLVRWQEAATRGDTLDLGSEMHRLAIAIIGKAILGTGQTGDAVEQALVNAYDGACQFINQRIASLVDMPLWIPTPFNRRFTRSMQELNRAIYQLIGERRGNAAGKHDVLARLIAARDPETGGALTDRQIHDHIITFFFAGQETTAEALTWAWYLLALNPKVEEKLHAEVDDVLQGRGPQSHDLPALEYTRHVYQETLRLYPSVWTFPRQAIRADALEGYEIPAGALILPTPYLTHRHPAFWDEPERFDPERFTPQRAATRAPHAYYPFGYGERRCIGEYLVLQEGCLVLATVAQRYSLRLVSTATVEPSSLITLHPAAPIRMTLTSRPAVTA